jgi:hypothetical protein
LSVASEAYGDDGYFALFTICFTCYIPKIKKVISILFCFKRGPRSTKTVPDASKMVQDAFYTAPIWFKMPEMH